MDVVGLSICICSVNHITPVHVGWWWKPSTWAFQSGKWCEPNTCKSFKKNVPTHVHMGQHMIWNENGKHVFLGSWILSRMVSEKHMPAQQKGHFMDFDSKIRSWGTKRPNTCTARIFFKPPLRPRINIFPIEQTWVVEPKQREFTRVFSWQLNKKPLETLSQRSAFLVAFVPHTVIYECGCSRILSSMSRIWALMAGSPNQWKLIFCQPRGLFLGPR